MESSVDKAVQIKKGILEYLEKNGPSLPVPIARELKINTLFASAFLSELLDDEVVKISQLKVGGSPLYYLPKHKVLLENFTKFLPPKEKEALNILKEKLVIKDLGLDPGIRIALRSIKDFSYPVVIEANNQKVLFWRYFTIQESEALERVKELIKSQIPQPRIPQQVQPQPSPQPQIQQESSKENIQEKPLAPILKQEEKPKEIKEEKKTKLKKGEFSEKIQEILSNLGLDIIEKLDSKKNEFYAKVLVNSQIGKSPYLCIAKDKKKLNENDFALAVQKAQNMKLPILFLSAGSPSVKAKNYLQTYQGLIKFKQLES
jgi:hypothetical protein